MRTGHRSTRTLLAAVGLLASTSGAPPAEASPGAEPAAPVTLDNFVRAESDLHFARAVQSGAFGKLVHSRMPAPIEKPSGSRPNRDTLESTGVFDLAAAAVTVTLPDPGGRYMTVQALSQDHDSVEVAAAPGAYTYTQERVGTRYLFLIVRTLLASERPLDLKAAHALQDRIRVEQERRGKFEVPRWDPKTLAELRTQLAQREMPAGGGEMFGAKGEVDPERHLLGTAIEWGGLPRRDLLREDRLPPMNDGQTLHTLTVRAAPVDGFWSISVYDAKGAFEPNELGACTLTSAGAQPNRDGSYTVQFGGCRGRGNNCLPITPGWTYSVRLYRPQGKILQGAWKFPEARPVLKTGE